MKLISIRESSAAPARNRASILDSDHDENYSRTPIVSNEISPQASERDTRWDQFATTSEGNNEAILESGERHPQSRIPAGLRLPGMEFVSKEDHPPVPPETNLLPDEKCRPSIDGFPQLDCSTILLRESTAVWDPSETILRFKYASIPEDLSLIHI